ncbi:MAG: hypothetical protein ABJN36_01220 [Cyclobacteriaceae bacterium]
MKKPFGLLVLIFFGCQSEQVKLPDQCADSTLSLTGSSTSANCGASDGSVQLEATGGEGPYSFSFPNMDANTSGTFSGIGSGTFTAEVADNAGCTVTAEITVSSAGGVAISSIDETDSGCDSSNGTITIAASGGAEPYTYSLDGAPEVSESSFNGLATGSYQVTVSDANDCETTQQVKILTGITLSSHVEPIITSNCAVSGCHNGSQSPNLSSATGIVSSASRIRARTSAGTMPPSGSLAQSQIDEIACWVNDGALNN